MAYEFNDLKGFLFLVLYTIPLTATTNIDCNGKPFYCVNATHFMICVELGGGATRTIDDFVIPCPATTVCRPNNRFECDFPDAEEPLTPLHVIGVSTAIDHSVSPLLIVNVTTPMQVVDTTPSQSLDQNLPILAETSSPNPITGSNMEYTGGNNNVFKVTTILPSTLSSSYNLNDVATSDYSTNGYTTNIPTLDVQSTTEITIDNTMETTTIDNLHTNFISKDDKEITKTTQLIRSPKNSENKSHLNMVTTTSTPIINAEPNLDLYINDDKFLSSKFSDYKLLENNQTNNELSAANLNPIGEISTTEKVLESTVSFVDIVTTTDNQQNIINKDNASMPANNVLDTEILTKTDGSTKIISDQLFHTNDSFIDRSETTDAPPTIYAVDLPLIVSNKTANIESINSTVQSMISSTLTNQVSILSPIIKNDFADVTTSTEMPKLNITTIDSTSTTTASITTSKINANNTSIIDARATNVQDRFHENVESYVQSNTTLNNGLVKTANGTTGIDLNEVVLTTNPAPTIAILQEQPGKMLNNSHWQEANTFTSSEPAQMPEIVSTTPTSYNVDFYQTTFNSFDSNLITTLSPNYDTVKNNDYSNFLLQDISNASIPLLSEDPGMISSPTAQTYTAHIFHKVAVETKTFAPSVDSKKYASHNKLLDAYGPFNVKSNFSSILPASVTETVNETYQGIENASFTPLSAITNSEDNNKYYEEPTTAMPSNSNVPIIEDTTSSLYVTEKVDINVMNSENAHQTSILPFTVVLSTSSTNESNPNTNEKQKPITKNLTDRSELDINKTVHMELLTVTDTSQTNSSKIHNTTSTTAMPDNNLLSTYYTTESSAVNIMNTESTIMATITSSRQNTADQIQVDNITRPTTNGPSNLKIDSQIAPPLLDNMSITATKTNTTLVKNDTASWSDYNISNQANVTELSKSTQDNVIVQSQTTSLPITEVGRPDVKQNYISITTTKPATTLSLSEASTIIAHNLEATPASVLRKSTFDSSLLTASENIDNIIYLKTATNNILEKNDPYIFSANNDITTQHDSLKKEETSIPSTDHINFKKPSNNIVDSLLPVLIKTEITITDLTINTPETWQSKPTLSPTEIIETQTTDPDYMLTSPKVEKTRDVSKKNVSDLVLPNDKTYIKNSSKSVTPQSSSVKTKSEVEHIHDPYKTISLSLSDTSLKIKATAKPGLTNIMFSEIILRNNTATDINSQIRNMSQTVIKTHKEALQKNKRDNTISNVKPANVSNREDINLDISNSDLKENQMNIEIGVNKQDKDDSIEGKYESTTAYFEVPSQVEITTSKPYITTKYNKSVSDIEHKPLLMMNNNAEYNKKQAISSSIPEFKITILNANEDKYSSVNNRDRVFVLDKEQYNNSVESAMSKTQIKISNSSSYLTEYQDMKNNVLTSKIQNRNISQKPTLTNDKQEFSTSITKYFTMGTNLTHKPSIDNASIPFDCWNNSRGKYADSKDCRKFYICLGKIRPIVGVCPNDTVFSEINKQCTRNLSHCVRNNQFHCLYEGRFSDFLKDNVYYICVKHSLHFLRYKLQCQNGFYLNKATVKCEKRVVDASQYSSSASENSQINDQKVIASDAKKAQKLVEKSDNKKDFECKKEGKFPYAQDCTKYYVCSKSKKNEYRRKIKKCSDDEVYDQINEKCVSAESYEC